MTGRAAAARAAGSTLAVLVAVLVAAAAGCSAGGGVSRKSTPAEAAATDVQLAIEYLKIGKLSNARDFAETALKQDPGNANVQLTAGLVYERLNEMGKADKAYASAARLGVRDPDIQNNYAGFLCRSGKTAEGEKLFVQTARDPLYRTPEVALVNAGVCVRSTGNLVDAERYFSRALAIRPSMPEALLQLGNVAIDRGDAAAALDAVQRYLAVNAPNPDILWLGFRAQRKLGNATAAAGFARRVQAEFPDSEQAQTMRAGLDR